MSDYAVVWSDDGIPQTGRLVIAESAIEIHAAGKALVVPAAAIARAYVARGQGDRLRSCPTLVVEQHSGPKIRIGALGLGVVSEVLDLVTALCHAATDERALVILPLRRGAAGEARELIAAGPPFDPAAVGLRRHDVFVTDREAIFILEGPEIEKTLERLLKDPSVWQRASRWRSCLGGRPRTADHAYGWADG